MARLLPELGVSNREDYEHCPVYWYNAQLVGSKGWGIVPLEEAADTGFGTIGHKGLQIWYENLRQKKSFVEASALAIEGMKTLRQEKFASWCDQQNVSPDSFDDPHFILLLVEAFMKGYEKFYADDAEFEILATEWDFNLPAVDFYPHSSLTHANWHWGVSPSDMPNIRGTVDLILRDSRGIILMDHKFHKFIDTDLESKMSYWKQPLVYARAVETSWGEPIVGYLHNQIRKPVGLKPRLNKDTQTYESMDDFLERLSKEYVSFPDYTLAYPDRKKGYFFRSQLLRPVTDERFWDELACLDAEMVVIREELPAEVPMQPPPPVLHRRSPSACRKYGKPCKYEDLCKYGYTPLTLENYAERSDPHP